MGGEKRQETPWGYFVVLDEGATYKVKRFVVKPGQRLSLQRHSKRAEHWFVVEGEGVATVGDRRILLAPGISLDVPRMSWHRVQNTGAADLVIAEIQTGTYFGEDDIERKADDYGRE